jgi:hypothetical protein
VWSDASAGFPGANKPNAHPPKRPEGVYGKLAIGVLDYSSGPEGQLASCGRERSIKIWDSKGAEKKTAPLPEPDAHGAAAPRTRILPTRVSISFAGKIFLAGDSAGRRHS